MDWFVRQAASHGPQRCILRLLWERVAGRGGALDNWRVPGKVRKGFLWTLKHTLNRLTVRLARSGHGPFSLVRHVGRRSGRAYETPVILAEVPGGFVAELTYGPDVDWYRNVVAAGGCTVLHHGRECRIDRISQCTAEEGLAAYGYPERLVLRLMGRKEFRRLSIPPVA
jgi:deazaflavin-dependent oxidoreductase (nitroreductase family)